MEKVHWSVLNGAPEIDTVGDVVVLNIGGVRFETYLTTLQRFPDSALGVLAQYVKQLPVKGDLEFYIDRNPVCFAAILDFMRTGHLHNPPSVCGAMFRQELRYWGVQERIIEKCCINSYIRALDTESKLRYFTSYLAKLAESIAPVPREGSSVSYWKKVAWKTMMMPTYSREAMIYNVIAYLLLIVNVCGILYQSMLNPKLIPLHGPPNSTHDIPQNFTNCHILFDSIIVSHTTLTLFFMDVVFSVLFTLEIFVRIIVAPTWGDILKSVSNHVEFVSLLPFYFMLFVIIYFMHTGHCPFMSVRVVRVLLILRIVRIFRLCFVLRHYCTFRACMYTLQSSCRELLILFTLVTLSTIVMGSLVSLIESAYVSNEEKTKFEDLSSGLWWALVTITTVGYGDVVPESPPGRLMTVLVALSGITVIALATPMVSSNFNLIYTFLLGNELMNGSGGCNTNALNGEITCDEKNNGQNCSYSEVSHVSGRLKQEQDDIGIEAMEEDAPSVHL